MPNTNSVSPPDLMLKIIWMVHFALVTWSLMSAYMPIAYLFCHSGVLAFCFWAIVSKESMEAVIMTFITVAFSIINDILLISIYEPRTHDMFEVAASGPRNEHRFAVAMSIINLIIKPITLFLLFRIYQSRSTGESVFSTNGINIFHSSNSGQQPGTYSNIDSSQRAHPGIHGQNPQPQGNQYGTQGGYQSTPQGYQDPSSPPPATNEGQPTHGSAPRSN